MRRRRDRIEQTIVLIRNYTYGASDERYFSTAHATIRARLLGWDGTYDPKRYLAPR